MKACGGVDVWTRIFLTSALVVGEWAASHPDRVTPGERATGTHWIGGWVGPRAGLDKVEKRKFLPVLESNSDPSVIQPVASRYTDWAIPAPYSETGHHENFPQKREGEVSQKNRLEYLTFKPFKTVFFT
jgi:hypothetical protein